MTIKVVFAYGGIEHPNSSAWFDTIENCALSAFRLADRLGRSATSAASVIPTHVVIHGPDDLVLPIRVFEGGLSGSA